MPSIVRTEIRVPAGMVMYAGGCVPGSVHDSRELAGRGCTSPGAAAESNRRKATSARLYFCTDEPTWKLISLSVPPTNLPLIRLPFFSSRESPHAMEAATHNATTKLRFGLIFIKFL